MNLFILIAAIVLIAVYAIVMHVLSRYHEKRNHEHAAEFDAFIKRYSGERED